MTPATEVKRQQLLHFIQVHLSSEPSVKGVVAVGSIGAGTAQDTSDIDAVVFLDPYDPYIIPAEAIWQEEDGSFHSIFTKDEHLQTHGLQVDFNRLDWNAWRNPLYAWPEPMKAEISSGWISFDPSGEVADLIQERTHYTEELRFERLDESITWLDQLLGEGELERVWSSLGPLVAHSRLNAAYDYLIQLLFAYNRSWRTWKTREMTAVLQLSWLPPSFNEYVLSAVGGHTGKPLHNGYLHQVGALDKLWSETIEQLIEDGLYGADPIAEAFIRSHEEPGRAWNIQEWMEKHRIGRS